MSFESAKIVDYLGDNKFVIEIPKEHLEKTKSPAPERIIVAHDYVRFFGPCSYEMQSKNGKYPYKPKHGASNWVSSRSSITISIRDMIKIVLPYLNSHEYLQEKHIEDRTHTEDGTSYKKGDKYPAYAYGCSVLQYYKNGKLMVSFKKIGDTDYETVSFELFEQIKDSINWYNEKPKDQLETL